MSTKRTFIEDVLEKTATVTDIGLYVNRWHDGNDARTLQEFLGMTNAEYEMWGKTSDRNAINKIIADRKKAVSPVEAVVEPICKRHTFFLTEAEYKNVNKLLTSSDPNNWAEKLGCVDGFHTKIASRIVSSIDSKPTRIELTLWHTSKKGFFVNVALVGNQKVLTGSCIYDISRERVILRHDNIVFDIGVDTVADFGVVEKMFESGNKVPGCEACEETVLVMLDWPRALSAAGVVSKWFMQQQHMLYLYEHEKLWITCDGKEWEQITFDNRPEGTMITVYRV